jgi:hypothetical protein
MIRQHICKGWGGGGAWTNLGGMPVEFLEWHVHKYQPLVLDGVAWLISVEFAVLNRGVSKRG